MSGGVTHKELAGRISPVTPKEIRAARETLGLNQAQLARLLRVEQPVVSDWERGRRYPRPEYLERLAALLRGEQTKHRTSRSRRSENSTGKISEILDQARSAAVAYYRITGRPLGVTSEIGEYEAARHLDLTLAKVREAGYDAKDRRGRKLQIKSRAIPSSKAPGGQRIGSISLDKPWDAVLLIIMDEELHPTVIYEADRKAVAAAIKKPGSRARNERGALSVSKFKSIGKQVWPKESIRTRVRRT